MKHTIYTLVLLLASSSLAQEGTVSAPVYKPTFMTGYDSFSGGTAFVCTNPSEEGLVLVTALHLFGPVCGLKEQMSPAEVVEVFHAVTGIGMADYSSFVTSTSPVLLPTANVSDDDGCAGDLVIYKLPEGGVKKPLVFSASVPRPGDSVYLLGRQRGSEVLERLKAEVVESDEKNLVYRYEKKSLQTAGTSGAPVVNEGGEVVGMNTGGAEKDGNRYGFANPTVAILKTIKVSASRD